MKQFSSSKKAGFTLIELLVVIAIIGLLATLGVVQLNSATKKARDAKRISDIAQIQKALELYKDQFGEYPGNTDDDHGGWDAGYMKNGGSADAFIAPLATSEIMKNVPKDSNGTNVSSSYMYYRYGAGDSGCDASRGGYYVLVIMDLESSPSSPSPSNPGWSCPSRNWSSANGVIVGYTADYVTGAFTN